MSVCFENPLSSPSCPRLLGPVATVPGPPDFRVISASHPKHQTSAIWSKSYMISAIFFHDQARKALKNTLIKFCGPNFRNVVIAAS